MNKIERVAAALKGADVDRPPFSFWYHFGLQHCSGERNAEAEIEFFRAYDLDFLKVMNDYPYPAPEGEAWGRLKVLSGDEEGMGEQLKSLRMIARALAGEAYFVETIFSPWTTARRLTDTATLLQLKRDDPDLLLEIMDTIARSLANYARKAVEAGAAGIFLSLSGATPELMSYKEYERFGRPFDLMILEAVKGAPFNILHIHGKKIYFSELLDYPVQAVNWSHMYAPPTLTEGRKLYKGCLLGGIDEARFAHSNKEMIERQIRQAVEMVGSNNLMITPGCSIESDSQPKLLKLVRQTVTALQ